MPRFGTWSTISRNATGSTQSTQVTRNKYKILSRIIRSNGSSALSSWGVHYPNNGTVRTYYTGVRAGTPIRAQFKTTVMNYRTTTATLGWRP